MYNDRRPLHLPDRRPQYAICAFCLVTCIVFRGPLPLCVFAVFFPDDLLDMVSDLSGKPITAKYTSYVRVAGIVSTIGLILWLSTVDSAALAWYPPLVAFLAAGASCLLYVVITWALGMESLLTIRTRDDNQAEQSHAAAGQEDQSHEPP